MSWEMSVPVPDRVLHQGNAKQPWDDFDPFWYLSHNYETLRSDDRQFIEWMADFFATAPMAGPGHGLDVGSGTNLYPALAMLPRCHRITMVERGLSNVRWLMEAVVDFAETWEPFWRTMVDRQPERYGPIAPRAALEARAEVLQGDIFELPSSRYDIGTMFFVAESITARRREFERATQRFVLALKRRAPFAAAFMMNSRGYRVGNYHFPAVAVGENDVRECLAQIAYDVDVHVLGVDGNPLREGYDGMILVTGYAGRK